MDGWVKLHRKLIEKAIWQCSTPEQKVILITILMNVNHEENEWEWQGKKFVCEPGQMVTSLSSLAEKCGKGVSIQNVRTALDKFEKYGFLTNESTKTGRLITIVNWAFYQENSCEVTKQSAKYQQSGNKELTTNKNDKNDKNDKKDIYSTKFAELWLYYPKKVDKAKAYKKYNERINEGYSEEELLRAVKNYAEECEREQTDQRYIKHCKTFLDTDGTFTEYMKKKEIQKQKPYYNKFNNFKSRDYDFEALERELL